MRGRIQKSQPVVTTSSSSSSPAAVPISVDPSGRVDGWALMTREVLDTMSYEEREVVSTHKNTVVYEMNMF